MSQTGIRILPEALRSIDSSTFTGSYQAIGTPLAFASNLIKFVNNSTSDITISWNGTIDHDFVPKGGFCLYDIASDAEEASSNAESKQLYIAAQTQFYVKGSSGTGSVYMFVCHATAN